MVKQYFSRLKPKLSEKNVNVNYLSCKKKKQFTCHSYQVTKHNHHEPHQKNHTKYTKLLLNSSDTFDQVL